MAAEVEKAILTLYRHSDPSVKKQADNFLQDFQKQREAWVICQSLLHSTTFEVQFFASTTLLKKVRTEWEYLSLDEKKTFLSEVVSALHKNVNGQQLIIQRLCVILSAGVLRTDTCMSFMKDLFASWSTNVTLDTRGLLLEFFGNVAEEFDILVIPFNKRTELKNNIKSILESIINFTKHVLQEGSEEVKATALSSLLKWIKFGVPITLLVNGNPSLFDIVFASLSEPTLFPYSSEVLLELYSRPESLTTASNALATRLCFDRGNDGVFFINVVKRLIELKSQTYSDAVQEGDVEYCRGLCQIAMAMAESHIQLVVSSDDCGPLVGFLLECSGHPNHYVAQTPLEWWVTMETNLREGNEQYRQKFIPIYEKLLEIIVKQCTYPGQDIEEEDYTQYRESASASLLSCFDMLGKRYLETLGPLIVSKTSQTSNWPEYESLLYAVSAVAADTLSEDEPIIKKIIESVVVFPLQPFIARTSVKLLGNCAAFLKKHADVLGPVITYILTTLTIKDKDVMFAAVTALNLICKSCASMMVTGLSTLIDVCAKNLTYLTNYQDQATILESLLHLVICLPPDQISAALHQLNSFALTNLSNLIKENQNSEISKGIVLLLDLLSSGLRLPNETSLPFSSQVIANTVLPVILPYTTAWAMDPNVMESLCNVYSALILLEKKFFVNYLSNVLMALLEAYRKHPFAPCLDVITTAIATIGNHETGPGFLSILTHVSEITFQLFQQDIANHLELVTAYFAMVTKAIQLIPHSLLPGSIFSVVFQLSTHCFALTDRESLSAISQFNDALFIGIKTKYPDLYPHVETILSKHGQEFIVRYVNTLASNSQCRPLINSESLFFLVQHHPSIIQSWVASALQSNSFPSNKLTNDEKAKFVEILIIVKEKRKFKSLINDFNLVCNGNGTTDLFVSYEL